MSQQVTDRKSIADVRSVMVTIIRDKHPNFKFGLNADQLRMFFPLVKHYRLARYRPRMRDNFYLGHAGRHDVHEIRYYFPVVCDEEGLIDHSGCVNCEPKKVMRAPFFEQKREAKTKP